MEEKLKRIAYFIHLDNKELSEIECWEKAKKSLKCDICHLPNPRCDIIYENFMGEFANEKFSDTLDDFYRDFDESSLGYTNDEILEIENNNTKFTETNCDCELVYHRYCIENYLLNICKRCPLCKKVVTIKE